MGRAWRAVLVAMWLGLTGCRDAAVDGEAPPTPAPEMTPPPEAPPAGDDGSTVQEPPDEPPVPPLPPAPVDSSTDGGSAENPPPPAPPPPAPPPPPSCVPRTCELVLPRCGEVDDGCGGTLRCDTCPSGQTCGEPGLANVCVASAAAPQTQWVETFPYKVTAVAAGSRANIAFITETPDGAAPNMLDPSGALLWSRPEVAPRVGLDGLAVEPSGIIDAWGWRDGAYGPGGPIAYTFDASGNAQAPLSACGGECTVGPYSRDAADNLLVSTRGSGSSSFRYSRPDGSGWSLVHSYRSFAPGMSHVPFDLTGGALFDAQGNVLTAGTLSGQGTFQDVSFGAEGQFSLVALKLAPDGALVWSWELPNTRGFVNQLGVTASGALVMQGSYAGTLKWAGGELRTTKPSSSEAMLMVLDAEGHLSWVQQLPGLPRYMVVSPSGQIALGSSGPRVLHVRVYDLEGHLRWSRTWTPFDESGSFSLQGMAWAGETLVLGGAFRGTVDFGTGPQQGTTEPNQYNGFILKLQEL